MIDVVPTLSESAGAEYPGSYEARLVAPLIGRSMLSLLLGSSGAVRGSDASFGWARHGQGALGVGRWKGLSLQPQPLGQPLSYDAERIPAQDLCRVNRIRESTGVKRTVRPKPTE